MEHGPPPFFKRGPAPLVRLFFFASLSIALLVADTRFRAAETLRSALAALVHPVQFAATAPFTLFDRAAGFFASQSRLLEENVRLRAALLETSRDAQQHEAAAAEAARLRRLIDAAERPTLRSRPAEILYAKRDPFAQRVIIDRGSLHGIAPGSPVIDEAGVLGQVTRVHPMVSEVTLITDKDQAIPVQVVRNGLRAVAYGSGAGSLELRFLASNAEIQNGDRLVTSGIDGTYPPGLAVARVSRIERDSANAFARIVCEPAAGVERGRHLLVIEHTAKPPPAPEERAESPAGSPRGKRARRAEGDGARD